MLTVHKHFSIAYASLDISNDHVSSLRDMTHLYAQYQLHR